MQPTSTELKELWQRVDAFRLDEPASRLTFTRRLARENGWTLGYALRVIGEYKRFMFMTVAADHPVTPSEDVDQVWHLHMAYTRSYWQDFCGQVLETTVHHGPARGVRGEHKHFNDQYNRTKASYAALFHELPPEDIWPAAEQRFSEDLRWQRVNLKRNWVIPKPRWPKWTSRGTQPRTTLAGRSKAAGLATLLIALPLTIGVVNPLDFNGPQFLVFFAIVAAMALVASSILRWYLLSLNTGTAVPLDQLDPLEIALLTDQGRLRFAQAGMAALTSDGSAEICEESSGILGMLSGAKKKSFQLTGKSPDSSSALLQRLHVRLMALGVAQLDEAIKESLSLAAEEEDRLEQRGLLTANWASSSALWIPLALPLLVLALGVGKVMIGLSREKPVAFLVVGCVAIGIVTIVAFCRKPRRTRAGDEVLEEAFATYRGLDSHSQAEGQNQQPDMIAMSVGLFGTTLLAGTALDMFYQSWPKSSGWNSGGCGGGGGCSGGGCGGGGCGGGGCGGCGG